MGVRNLVFTSPTEAPSPTWVLNNENFGITLLLVASQIARSMKVPAVPGGRTSLAGETQHARQPAGARLPCVRRCGLSPHGIGHVVCGAPGGFPDLPAVACD